MKRFFKLLFLFLDAAEFFLFSNHVFFLSGHLQKRLDFSEEPPPLPITQFQISQAVALDDANGTKLVLAFGEVSTKKQKLSTSSKLK